MKFLFTVIRILIAGTLVVYIGFAAAQQAYPNKPFRLITPYPPGSSPDTIARLIGPKLTESWGQQVVVDNRPGGNTIIGTDALVKSRPDGHTILLISTTHVLNALLLPSLPYDTLRDFAPVATLAGSELALVVNQSVPANTLQEFISLAKSKPGQLNYATASSGGPTHLAPAWLSIMTGIKMQHIPYKGSGPAVVDLVAGQVQLYFSAPISVIPHIKTGRLKAIAISGEARSPALPQVPTFTEAGLPGFDLRFWYGILAPAGTPAESVTKLSTELARIVVMPDIRDKLLGQGADPYATTPDQFAALMKADMAKYGKIIKAANIKLEH